MSKCCFANCCLPPIMQTKCVGILAIPRNIDKSHNFLKLICKEWFAVEKHYSFKSRRNKSIRCLQIRDRSECNWRRTIEEPTECEKNPITMTMACGQIVCKFAKSESHANKSTWPKVIIVSTNKREQKRNSQCSSHSVNLSSLISRIANTVFFIGIVVHFECVSIGFFACVQLYKRWVLYN